MKKAFILLAVCLPISMQFAAGMTSVSRSDIHPVVVRDWTKSATATWPAMKDGKTLWYKLDKKGGLWWSADGKKWAAAREGAWTDKEGKWLKIHEHKLVWSTDGNSWSEVPEWKWEGSDGKWYKFDNNWTLWVNE
ncbi:hypothetical protein HF324_10050 [Chitinophaga oryzae]|uniref:WWE domain-containing protein n=1 Tax=Chitinophaga oryzae TaxID=2725414 RepID=A0ABX6LEC8_9BACT|nr:hypothetical protein [Chitinophaga oryzae]QJB38182.1 hypothetical protein HF324_10050 [Chitinophaga oryzae]